MEATCETAIRFSQGHARDDDDDDSVILSDLYTVVLTPVPVQSLCLFVQRGDSCTAYRWVLVFHGSVVYKIRVARIRRLQYM